MTLSSNLLLAIINYKNKKGYKMAQFNITFELKSLYEDESLNLTEIVDEDMEADDLDDLFEILDEGDAIDEIDDVSVINLDTDNSPIEVNIEYVLISDEAGKVVYKDEDYKN